VRALIVILFLLVAFPARAAEPVHPELPETSGVPVRPLPTIKVGERTFYAHGADLLEWNGAAIIARTRLPARIATIAPRDANSLVVSLAPKSEFGLAGEQVDVIVRIDAPRPGRGFWSGGYVDTYLTLREARAVAPTFDPTTKQLDEQTAHRLIDALMKRFYVDQTNPFLYFMVGQVARRAGFPSGGARFFGNAANLRGASFNDLLRLSQMLEDEDQPAAAGVAFANGLAAMREAGIRSERLQSQVAFQALMGVPRVALSEALARGDVARVDAIEERVALAFPRLEGAHLAWRDLAAWMSAHGRPDLAAAWRSRADNAAASVSNINTTLSLDRLLPAILGMSVVAPIVAFVIGLRRGARRSDGKRRVVLDLISALAPLVATFALIVWANARVEVVARRAYAPMAILDDGVASPDVARFVEQRLVPSGERDQILAWIGNESRATREGSRFEGPAPDDATIRRAFETSSIRTAVRDTLAQQSALTSGPHALGFQHTFLIAGLLFIGGYFLGARTPRAAVAASRVVPGGPESLPIIGPLLGGAFLAALFSFAFGQRLLSSIETPYNARFFGFESIATAQNTAPDRTWAIAVIVVYAIVHLVGVRVDSVREAS